MGRRWTDADVERALAEFVESSSDLRAKAYTRMAPSREWPSVAIVVRRHHSRKFDDIIARVANEHGDPTAVYRWGSCPAGRRHAANPDIRLTVTERLARTCVTCDEHNAKWQQRRAALPTFAELHPYAVQWLDDPADANTKGEPVSFRCARCDAPRTPWTPRPKQQPECHYCRTVGDRHPGDLIDRHGGGPPVQLEHDIADALTELGHHTVTNLGVVIRQGAIIQTSAWDPDHGYPLPAIKPDIVLPNRRIAIEYDIDRNSHHSTERDIRQDRERDAALADIDWACLRIRHPNAPTRGEWPWRIETTSRSPRQIAALIDTALRVRADG